MIGLLLLLAGDPASAANRTVCFELKIRDERYDCPGPGTVGARRVCNATVGGDNNVYSYGVGWLYQLWDKDPDGSDEYIGTFITSGTGRRCASFPWEGETYHDGEAHPDVYIRLLPKVQAAGAGVSIPGSGPIITAVDGTGAEYRTASWRDGPSAKPDKYVAVNCTAGANCDILPGVAMTPTKSATTDYSLALMAIDSAQRGLNAFNPVINEDSGIFYHVDELSQLPDPTCTTACAKSRTSVLIPDTLADDGNRAAHELGHVLQMREFGQDGLRDDVTANGAGWFPTSMEFDSGATTEGWATYAAAAAWYVPDTAGVKPRFMGYGIEDRHVPSGMTCAESSGTALQVARMFWDMDDADDEGGDGTNRSTNWLLNRWDEFPDGFADREDFELGVDAVNIWDYAFNAILIAPDELLNITGNCVDAQDP